VLHCSTVNLLVGYLTIIGWIASKMLMYVKYITSQQNRPGLGAEAVIASCPDAVLQPAAICELFVGLSNWSR
jgi:hypothetical protein